jgi:transcriptional regulator with XRE-family HTH domain
MKNNQKRVNHKNHRLAWNLRRIRVRRGLSQEQLAVDADLAVSYISRLERNLENPTLAILDRLAKALDIKTGQLIATPRGSKPKPLRGGRKPRR